MNSPTPDTRSTVPSNSVVKAVGIGAPSTVVFGYLTGLLATKYNIPFEVAGAGLGLISTGFTTLVQYLTHGGRKGESG